MPDENVFSSPEDKHISESWSSIRKIYFSFYSEEHLASFSEVHIILYFQSNIFYTWAIFYMWIRHQNSGEGCGSSFISAGNLASWGNMTWIEFMASPTLALLSAVWIQCIFKIACYYRKLLCNCVDCLDKGNKDPMGFVQVKVFSLGAGEMAGLVKCHRRLRGSVRFPACM